MARIQWGYDKARNIVTAERLEWDSANAETICTWSDDLEVVEPISPEFSDDWFTSQDEPDTGCPVLDKMLAEFDDISRG